MILRLVLLRWYEQRLSLSSQRVERLHLLLELEVRNQDEDQFHLPLQRASKLLEEEFEHPSTIVYIIDHYQP